MMKNIQSSVVAVLVGLAGVSSAKELANTDKNGVGIKGYDPVAYFTEGKPVQGNAQFQSKHAGATYQFSKAENKALFDKDPAKYAPQFGGYCAYAVSKGELAPVDPAAFQIENGRLLLQYSKGIRDKFNKDPGGNLAKADGNWPGLVEKKGR